MLIEPLVGWVVRTFVPIFEGFDGTNLAFDLWSGSVTIKDVKLRQDMAGSGFEIPYSHLTEVRLQIPWASLRSDHVRLIISGLRVLVNRAPTHENQPSTERTPATTTPATSDSRAQTAGRTVAANAPEQTTGIWGLINRIKKLGKSVVETVVHNLVVEVGDVHISYADIVDSSVNPVLAMTSVRLERLCMRPCAADFVDTVFTTRSCRGAVERLYKQLSLEGFCASVDAAMPGESLIDFYWRLRVKSSHCDYVLRPFTAFFNVACAMISDQIVPADMRVSIEVHSSEDRLRGIELACSDAQLEVIRYCLDAAQHALSSSSLTLGEIEIEASSSPPPPSPPSFIATESSTTATNSVLPSVEDEDEDAHSALPCTVQASLIVPSIDVVLRGGEGGLLFEKRQYPGGTCVEGMIIQLRLESLDVSTSLEKSGALEVRFSLKSLAMAHVLSGAAGGHTVGLPGRANRTEWPLLLGPRGTLSDPGIVTICTYTSGINRKLPDSAWAGVRNRTSTAAPAITASVIADVSGVGCPPPLISFRLQPLELVLSKSSMESLCAFFERRLPRPVPASTFGMSRFTSSAVPSTGATVEPTAVETASPPPRKNLDDGQSIAIAKAQARPKTDSVPKGPFVIEDGKIDSLRIIVPCNDLHLEADVAWVELSGVGASSVNSNGYSRPSWAFNGSDVRGRYSLSTFSVNALNANVTTKAKLAASDIQSASATRAVAEEKEQGPRSQNIHAPGVCLVLGLRDGEVSPGSGYSVARLREAEPSPKSRLLSRSGPLVPAARLEAYFPAVNLEVSRYDLGQILALVGMFTLAPDSKVKPPTTDRVFFVHEGWELPAFGLSIYNKKLSARISTNHETDSIKADPSKKDQGELFPICSIECTNLGFDVTFCQLIQEMDIFMGSLKISDQFPRAGQRQGETGDLLKFHGETNLHWELVPRNQFVCTQSARAAGALGQNCTLIARGLYEYLEVSTESPLTINLDPEVFYLLFETINYAIQAMFFACNAWDKKVHLPPVDPYRALIGTNDRVRKWLYGKGNGTEARKLKNGNIDSRRRPSQVFFAMSARSGPIEVKLLNDTRPIAAIRVKKSAAMDFFLYDFTTHDEFTKSFTFVGSNRDVEIEDMSRMGSFARSPANLIISSLDDGAGSAATSLNCVEWQLSTFSDVGAGFRGSSPVLQFSGNGLHVRYVNRFVLETVSYIMEKVLPWCLVWAQPPTSVQAMLKEAFPGFEQQLDLVTERRRRIWEIATASAAQDAKATAKANQRYLAAVTANAPIVGEEEPVQLSLAVALTNSCVDLPVASGSTEALRVNFDRIRFWSTGPYGMHFPQNDAFFARALKSPSQVPKVILACLVDLCMAEMSLNETDETCEQPFKQQVHNQRQLLSNEMQLPITADSSAAAVGFAAAKASGIGIEDSVQNTDPSPFWEQQLRRRVRDRFDFDIKGATIRTVCQPEIMSRRVKINGWLEIGSTLVVGVNIDDIELTVTEGQFACIMDMVWGNFQEVPLDYAMRPAAPGEVLPLNIPIHSPSLTLNLMRDGSISDYSARRISKIKLDGFDLQIERDSDCSLNLFVASHDILAVDTREFDVANERERTLIKPMAPGSQQQLSVVYANSASLAKVDVQLTRTLLKGLGSPIIELKDFFSAPFLRPGPVIDDPHTSERDEESPAEVENAQLPVPNLEVTVTLTNSFYCLLEHFTLPNSRVLVLECDLNFSLVSRGDVGNFDGSTELQLELVQKELFFSALPNLQIENAISVLKEFQCRVDYTNHARPRSSDNDAMSRTVLAVFVDPVSAEVSTHDCILLMNIISNLLANLVGKLLEQPDTEIEDNVSLPDTSLSEVSLHEHDNDVIDTETRGVKEKVAESTHTTEQASAMIGDIHLVLANNSLGVPVVEIMLSNVDGNFVRENGDFEAKASVMLSSNYFNNEIDEWEPLIEPFTIINDVRHKKETGTYCVLDGDFFSLSLTSSMLKLLDPKSNLFKDQVTSSNSAIAPYRFSNNCGSEIVLDFKTDDGTLRSCTLAHGDSIPADFRVQRSASTPPRHDGFRATERSRFLSTGTSLSLHKQRYVMVSLDKTRWVSIKAVPVDYVGSHMLALTHYERGGPNRMEGKKLGGETAPGRARRKALLPASRSLKPSGHYILASVSLLDDGTKSIDIRSPMRIHNRTAFNLDAWIFSSSAAGEVREIAINRGQSVNVPFYMLNSDLCISIRQSKDQEHGPVISGMKDFSRSRAQLQEKYDPKHTVVCPDKEAKPMKTTKQSSFVSSFGLSSGKKANTVLPPWSCHRTLITESCKSGNEIDEVARIVDGESTFSIVLQPSLVVHNLLSTPMLYKILDANNNIVASGAIVVGGVLGLHRVDLRKHLYMKIFLLNHEWSDSVKIHSPNHFYPYGQRRKDVVLKGLKSRGDGKELQHSLFSFQSSTRFPDLKLHIERQGPHVYVFTDVWIVNRTQLPMYYRHTLPGSPFGTTDKCLVRSYVGADELDKEVLQVEDETAEVQKKATTRKVVSAQISSPGMTLLIVHGPSNEIEATPFHARLDETVAEVWGRYVIKHCSIPAAQRTHGLYFFETSRGRKVHYADKVSRLENSKLYVRHVLNKVNREEVEEAQPTKGKKRSDFAVHADIYPLNFKYLQKILLAQESIVMCSYKSATFGRELSIKVAESSFSDEIDLKKIKIGGGIHLREAKRGAKLPGSAQNSGKGSFASRGDSFSGGSGKEQIVFGATDDISGAGGANGDSPELRTEYSLGMRVKRMRGAFTRTRIITFEPRYIIKNSSENNLQIAQAGVHGDNCSLLIKTGEELPFHWPAASRAKMLQLRISEPGWTWSGEISAQDIGEVPIALRRFDATKTTCAMCILGVCVYERDSSFVIECLAEDREYPPYRIDNLTGYTLQYKQKNKGVEYWDTIGPRQVQAYAWDRPALPEARILSVRFPDGKREEQRHIRLDAIGERRGISLQRRLPSGVLEKPDRVGYMTKRDPYSPIWRRRQFILKNGTIYYFRGGDARVNNADLVGKIDLDDEDEIRIRILGERFEGVDGVGSTEPRFMAGGGSGRGGDETSGPGGASRDSSRISTAAKRGSRVDMSFALAALKQSGIFARRRIRKGSTTALPLMLGAAITATSTVQSSDAGPSTLQTRVKGTAIVTALVQSGNIPCRTRRDAIAVAQRLLDHGYLKQVALIKEGNGKQMIPSFFTQGFKAVRQKPLKTVRFRDNQDLYLLASRERQDQGAVPKREGSELEFVDACEAVGTSPKVPEFSEACEWHLVTRSREYCLRARSSADAREWAKAVYNAFKDAKAQARAKRPLTPISGDDGELIASVVDSTAKAKAPGAHARDQSWIAGSSSKGKQVRVDVHVEVVTDGPVKVLRLIEGGETEAKTQSGVSGARAKSQRKVAHENDLRMEILIGDIGISMVDGRPRELLYLSMRDVCGTYQSLASEQKINYSLSIQDLQLDNQLRYPNFPTLLRLRRGEVDDENDNANASGDRVGQPALQVHLSELDNKSAIQYYEAATVAVCPLSIRIDDENALAVMEMMRQLDLSLVSKEDAGGQAALDPMNAVTVLPSIILESQNSHGEDDQDDGADDEDSAPQEAGPRLKLYFGNLTINPLDVVLTYGGRHGSFEDREQYQRGSEMLSAKEGGDPASKGGAANKVQSEKMFAMLGLDYIPHFHDAKIFLAPLQHRNLYIPANELTERIGRHYLFSALKQVLKIIGSLDVFGNPSRYVRSFQQFVADPSAQGVKEGGATLVSNAGAAIFSVLHATTKFAHNGLRAAALDTEEEKAVAKERTKKEKTAATKGAAAAAGGVVDGISGLVTRPMRGAQKEGGMGFVKGLGRGLIGLVAKPLAGVAEAAAITTGEIAKKSKTNARRAEHLHREMQESGIARGRARPPRVIPSRSSKLPMQPFSLESAIANEVLLRTRDGRYWREELVYFYYITSDRSHRATEDAYRDDSIFSTTSEASESRDHFSDSRYIFATTARFIHVNVGQNGFSSPTCVWEVPMHMVTGICVSDQSEKGFKVDFQLAETGLEDEESLSDDDHDDKGNTFTTSGDRARLPEFLRLGENPPSNALALLSILGAVENFALGDEHVTSGLAPGSSAVVATGAVAKAAPSSTIPTRGYLRKQGGQSTTWHQRYFELCGDFLFYKKDKGTSAAVGVLPLSYLGTSMSDYRYLDVRANSKSLEIFDPSHALLVSAKERNGVVQRGLHQIFRLEGDSVEASRRWVSVIRERIEQIRERGRRENDDTNGVSGKILSLPATGMCFEDSRKLANELEVQLHKIRNT